MATRILPREVRIGNVVIGGERPLLVQTMLSTHTSDIDACVNASARAFDAGAGMVRLTVPTMADVENLREIHVRLREMGYGQPLVADVHFRSEIAIAAASVVEKVRINPGNFHRDFDKACEALRTLLAVCKEHGTAIRIGINHGSLGERITSLYGDTPLGMCKAALEWIDLCEAEGFHNLVISLKSSNTKVMVAAYRLLGEQMQTRGSVYPLHLGVTEAGGGDGARMKTAVALSTLLAEGLGSTLRVSLTEDIINEVRVGQYFASRYDCLEPSSLKSCSIDSRKASAVYSPGSDSERLLLDVGCDWGKYLLDDALDDVAISVDDASFSEEHCHYLADELLQAARKRFYRPEYIACPGCGRTQYDLQRRYAQVVERTSHLNGVVIAVMGCIVNGPGEMADADYGYVGEGAGKVSIYRRSERVLSHVPEEDAIDALLDLIDSDK